MPFNDTYDKIRIIITIKSRRRSSSYINPFGGFITKWTISAIRLFRDILPKSSLPSALYRNNRKRRAKLHPIVIRDTITISDVIIASFALLIYYESIFTSRKKKREREMRLAWKNQIIALRRNVEYCCIFVPK